MQLKKIRILLSIALCLFLFVLTACTKNTSILKRDGLFVNERELAEEVKELSYEVTQFFVQKHQAKVDKDFWSKNFSGEEPLQILQEKVLEKLSIHAAARKMAQEQGLVASETYDAFLQRLEEENQARKKALQTGQAVYGLSQFTERMYLHYELDFFKNAYIAEEKNPQMQLTEEEILTYYEKEKDTFFRSEDALHLKYLYIPYEALGFSKEQKESLQRHAEDFLKDLHKGIAWEEALKAREDIGAYVEEVDLSSQSVSAYREQLSEVFEQADLLQEGEQTLLLDKNGAWLWVHLLEREEKPYFTLEEVISVVKKHLREQKYQQLLQQRAKESIFEYQDKKLKENLLKIIQP